VTAAKPDPEVFLKAAEWLDTPPDNSIVFEDSIAGIKAANTAKMLSIGIGNKDILIEADYCFNNFTEFDYQFFENTEV
jgi:beta-phosphoglucomutase